MVQKKKCQVSSSSCDIQQRSYDRKSVVHMLTAGADAYPAELSGAGSPSSQRIYIQSNYLWVGIYKCALVSDKLKCVYQLANKCHKILILVTHKC